jgi:alkylated DNA repair dioxygenase AlkB
LPAAGIPRLEKYESLFKRFIIMTSYEKIPSGNIPSGHLSFGNLPSGNIPSGNLLPSGGEAWFYPDFFPAEAATQYFENLLGEIDWKQQPIKIFGKAVMQPRLTAWYGDPGKTYAYSGISLQPLAWTETLLIIRESAENVAGVAFNGALLNQYRDGRDSMGWHRDNEKELGRNPVIGSVSFGATRQFQFRKYAGKEQLLSKGDPVSGGDPMSGEDPMSGGDPMSKRLPISLDLTHGSFLLMKGETQHHWEHRVAKSTEAAGVRINITFRVL